MSTTVHKSLTRGYILALILIGGLMICGYFIVQSVVKEQVADAYTINVMGRQRMLSQKISKLVLELSYMQREDAKYDSWVQDLDSNLFIFQNTHQNITGELNSLSLRPNNTLEKQALLEEMQPYYYNICLGAQQVLGGSYAIEERRDKSLQEGVTLVMNSEGYFLPLMNELVGIYEKESLAKVRAVIAIETTILTLGLLLLFLTATLIFQPLIKKVKDAYIALEEKNKDFASVEEELRLSNDKLMASKEQLYTQNKHLASERKRLEEQRIDLQSNQDRLAGMMMELRKKNIAVQRLSMVAELTSNLVIITDAREKIEWVNPSFEKISGYSLEEVKGRKPGDFLQGKDTSPKTRAIIREALVNQEKIDVEILNYSKEGNPYWLQLSISPFFNTRGTIQGYFAIQRDITKKKNTEEALKKAYYELQIREEELVQQAKELQIINGKLKDANVKEKAQLVAIEQLQKAVFNSGSIAITDTEGIILEVNDRLSMNSGYEAEELIGKSMKVLDSNYHTVGFWEEVANTLEVEGSWRGEVCSRNKKGELYWNDRAVSPIYNQYGDIERYIIIERNITEKKDLERLQVLELENSEMANYIMSQAEGTHKERLEIALIVATRHLKMDMGIVSEIDPSQNLYKILTIHNVDESDDNLKEGDTLLYTDSYCQVMISEGKELLYFEDILETKYKDAHCFKLFGLRAYMGTQLHYKGKPLGTLNFTSAEPLERPITHADRNFVTLLAQWIEHILGQKHYEDQLLAEAKKLEIANKQANEALAQLKLAQQQLVQSEKMSSLGVLTAGIAHEINNPVNFVSGGVVGIETCWEDLEKVWQLYERLDIENVLELLPQIEELKVATEYDETKTDMFELLKDIEMGAKRIAVIVKNLKAFSHSGTSKYSKASLPENIGATISILKSKLAHRIEVIEDYEDGFPSIQCNIGEVNQVLMNLISNAADAIEGEGTISIKGITLPNDNAPKEICISITDTGSGIAEENLDKIFEPFFSTKKVGEGTGLGLSISYGVVQDHGGSLKVESKVGEGTTFYLTLPIEPENPM